MKRWKIRMAACFIMPALAFSALNIPITVKDGASAGNAAGVPVKIGVPLPLGTLEDVSTLRVTDASGNTIPAQFNILGRWLPNSTSIRVVLVQFDADVISAGRTRYFLRDGGTGNSFAGVTYTEAADRFVVNAGTLKFEIRKSRFNVIDNLWFDANNDGVFDAAEQMISSADNNGAALWDVSNAVTRDTSKSGLNFQVEEAGPVRFALRVESPTDATASGWGFVARIYAYYNQPYVVLDYYLKNSAYGVTGHHLNFNKFAIVEQIQNLGTCTASLGGTLLDNTGAFQGALGASSIAEQATAWKKFAVNGGAVQTDVCAGYADISDGTKGVMAVIRKFSNLWPDGLEVTPAKQLSLNLWPAGRVHTMIDETRRSHQIMLYFHGAATQADLFKQAKLFQRYPVPALTPAVYAAAHAIGDYGGIYQADTAWNEALYIPAAINAGDSSYTGWWNWGGDDARRLSNGYGIWPFQATTYISCASPDAFYYLDDRTRHNAEMRPMWMDDYQIPRDGGMLYDAYVNAPHPVGLRAPKGPWDVHKNWSEWDNEHTWLYEMCDYYFFSGERYNIDNMRMIADYIIQEHSEDLYGVTGEGFNRTQGEQLNVVLDVYKMTGEDRYLNCLMGYARWVLDNYTSRFGVFATSTFQQCLFVNTIGDIYFLLPENTPKDREFKERYLLMLEGANNGQVYWGGTTSTSANSWGFNYVWSSSPYARLAPGSGDYYTSYMMNQIGMIYFLMGDPVYRNSIQIMCVPYYGNKTVNINTMAMDNIFSNNQSTGSYFRTSSAAWYDTAAKKAQPLPQISDIKAIGSAGDKVDLTWTSVGGTAYRVHWATKPVVERFDPIGDGSILYPHPDSNTAVANIYNCFAVDANFTPKAVGQRETLSVGAFPDTLSGRKIYFDIQAVNVVSEIDQYRSPLSNTDSIVLVSAGTDTTTHFTLATPFEIREAHSMDNGSIIVALTLPVDVSGATIGVKVRNSATGQALPVSGLDIDTVCNSLFRIRTAGIVEGSSYAVVFSGLVPAGQTVPDTVSFVFTASFKQNKYSVRKFNFGSQYSGSGYEGDHIFNGTSGWGVYLSGGCTGFYGAVTTRDDPSGTTNDTAKYSMSSVSCGPRAWFKMLVSTEIKDYRLKVCAGRSSWAPDSVLLFVEDSAVWNKAVCAAAGKQWIYLDSIPIRIEDGMLDIDWSYLCYVNLWPVFHFKAVNFTDVPAEDNGAGESAGAFVQNFPNPFNPTTQIIFSFGKELLTCARIGVYDIRGRRVADLTPKGAIQRRVYRVEWGCGDIKGKRTASQIFIVRLIAGNKSVQKKLILLR